MTVKAPEPGWLFISPRGRRCRVLRVEGSRVFLWNEATKIEEKGRWALMTRENGWHRVLREPKDSDFTLGQLQREHAPWCAHNFGDIPAYHPLLGIIEELGELEDAKNTDDIKDGLADTVVFMAHFSNAFEFDLDEIAARAMKLGYRPVERKAIGKLAHHFLKREQGIRGTPAEHREKILEALVEIYATLLDTATEYDLDLLQSVEETWAHVKKRDWKKNATTGT